MARTSVIKQGNVTKRPRRQWCTKEKLEVLNYYKQGHSKRATAA
ncbi:8894_t:CDS:1, partial [Funneliformis mosseae]